MPFAAFFVARLLLLCIPRRSRKAGVCLLLGAAGRAWCGAHYKRPAGAHPWQNTPGDRGADRRGGARGRHSYYPGIVDAVLRVEKVNGSAAGFRVECALPECKAGERVQGRFTLRPRHPEAGTACMRTASLCRRKWTRTGRSSPCWAKAAASAPAPTACSKDSVRAARRWTGIPAACWLP